MAATDPAPLLFLSHAEVDTEAARELKRKLKRVAEERGAVLEVWFDKDDLIAGLPWQRQLEEAIEQRATAFAVYLGSTRVVNWVQAEVDLALSRATRDGDRFPFVPVVSARAPAGTSALPGFARHFHAVRDVENDEGEFEKLLAVALGRGAEAGRTRWETEPFFGLRAIDEERSHLFFGREDETEELVQRLQDQRLLLVVGDSGSGKSSLVGAGLVPRWRGGALAKAEGRRPDEEVWHVVGLRPGGNPRRALGEAVEKAARQLGFAELDALAGAAEGRASDRVRRALRCGLPPDRTRTLVVVDQFEELVTLAPKEQRRPFVELLLDLADPADSAFAVALTMRRDYYNLLSAAECRPLYDRLEAGDRRGRYSLGRMSDDGLRRIVTEPLRLAGVGQDEREALAGAVLQEDVGQRAGDLALVQFALTRAWERRAEFGGDLLHAYHGVGGVEGALAGEAERVFERVLGGEANAAEVGATLIRLARLEGIAGPTQRVARRREFSDERWALLQALADVRGNRLVLVRERQPDGGAAGPDAGDGTAEIAHEALLTRWPRLHAWLSEAPDDKRMLDRLADRAAEWADAAPPDKGKQLARSDAQRQAFDLLARARPLWLSAEERAFVEASNAAYDTQELREKQALERETKHREEAERACEREHGQRKKAEQALEAAERARHRAHGAVPALAAALRDATRALGAIGPAAVSALAATLSDTEVMVRRAAAEILGSVGRSRRADDGAAGRRLQAWISERNPRTGQPFSVSVNIGSPRESTAASTAFNEPEWRERELIPLLISLSSMDCDVEPGAHELMLPKLGSTQVITFSVTAKEEGEKSLSIMVYLAKQMILLQSLSFVVEIVSEKTPAHT